MHPEVWLSRVVSRQQSQMTRVPELARLGPVRATLQPTLAPVVQPNKAAADTTSVEAEYWLRLELKGKPHDGAPPKRWWSTQPITIVRTPGTSNPKIAQSA